MVVLTCPLCCNETFSTVSSLKCHILEIVDNLMCPKCNTKFDKLQDLVDHLDNCETEDEGLQDSLLAKALLEPKIKSSEEGPYYCQLCELKFDDINQHLNELHEGQEVILEEETADLNEITIEDNTVFIISRDEDFEEDPLPEENSDSSSNKLKTVTEQDIKDKDGRLYTRKVVKIDKFWLQDPIKDSPIKSSELNSSIIEINKCQNCDMYFPAMETHDCLKTKDPKSDTNSCEVCNTAFSSFKSLRLHRRMHDPIKIRERPANESIRQMFICKICNKTYDKEFETVHMSSHSGTNGFICQICNRKFYTKTNLDMHMKAHTNNKKFTCSYCKKSFVTYDSLTEHLSNQCQKRPYSCQFCGRRFARPHEKVKHERIHTGEKPHVCDICGKRFRVSYCLTLHMRTHSGTRPYQCKQCLKRFKSHSVYNHHLLTHSDVRAYKCPYCPKAFKTSVQLAGHKNSHTKPFTCNECNRPFASLYAVRAHMETHKRENNLRYDCWKCGALYSRAFALRDHMKQQHQQESGDKAKAELVQVVEEMDAASSILVSEQDIILGLEGAENIEIIEGEGV